MCYEVPKTFNLFLFLNIDVRFFIIITASRRTIIISGRKRGRIIQTESSGINADPNSTMTL